MIRKEHVTILMKQFAEGAISKEEYLELMVSFKTVENEDATFMGMDQVWTSLAHEREHTDKEMDLLYQKLVADPGFRKVIKVRFWPRIAIAASILLVLGLGAYFFIGGAGLDKRKNLSANEITPGKNIAILTLGNGKTIRLNEAKTAIIINTEKLSYDDGSNVMSKQQAAQSVPTSLNQINTITTPMGGTYQIVLQDGTKVWLNAGSSLRFPSTFKGEKHRKVELSGEGYFEVEKDKHHPFIIKTDKQELEVLGTQFNINGYADETSIKTTLIEGSIKIIALSTAASIVLKPGQESHLTDRSLSVTAVNPAYAIAWKEGYFKFDTDDLGSIMRKIARWYDVAVVFEDEKLKSQTFSGSLSKYKSVTQVLTTLGLTNAIQFKIIGRKIIVNKYPSKF